MVSPRLRARHRRTSRSPPRAGGDLRTTVNAYKRLRPASLSGYWANWGYDHRGPPFAFRASAPPERVSNTASVMAALSCTVRLPPCCRRRVSVSLRKLIRESRRRKRIGYHRGDRRSARDAAEALDVLELTTNWCGSRCRSRRSACRREAHGVGSF